MAVTWATALPNLHAGLKKYFHHANAIEGLRFDVLDIVDRGGEGAFEAVNDAAGNLLGVHAGVIPQDADDRNVDIRKDVRGGAKNGNRADNQQQNGGHDKGIWPA